MRKLGAGIVVFFLLLLAVGCSDECTGFDEEPFLGIDIFNGVSFDDIYTIRGPGDTIRALVWACEDKALPLPINRDTFMVYLRKGSKHDSVKLSYHPDVYFESSRCGQKVRFNGIKTVMSTLTVEVDTVPAKCTATVDYKPYYEMRIY